MEKLQYSSPVLLLIGGGGEGDEPLNPSELDDGKDKTFDVNE